MRDYRLWWGLFVFFLVISVVVVQRRYRRWVRARRALADLDHPEPAGRLVRLEGWRIVLMMVSLVAMTGLVFAVLLRAPPALISLLRLLAVAAVAGVLVLGLKR
jgi:hypothetical protein